jgi:hypothetical protein
VSRLPCDCGQKQRYRGLRPRRLLTIVGDVVVPRRYFACGCGCTAAPMDAWAGIGSRMVSAHARRVIVLAGSTWSFDQAASKLSELCRLKTSNDTIRAICDEEGKRVDEWIRRDDASVRPIHAASGEWEFSSDGTSVNTIDGWREIRLSVLSKRESAPPAGPRQWDQRVLPAPTARLAWSQIADCRRIGARWERMFEHAGVDERGQDVLSVIADGAKWIWEQARERLPDARTQWVVDVYHVSQHLHACGKGMFGQNGPEALPWAQAQLQRLIQMQGPAYLAWLDQTIAGECAPAQRAAMRQLRGYLADNRDRMWYRDRLAAGRPIGSGLIEGGCKNVLGARLKLNAARWRIQRAERMGQLRCLQYSDLWESYWNSRAA